MASNYTYPTSYSTWTIYVDEISYDFAGNTSYVRVRGYMTNRGTYTSSNTYGNVPFSVSGDGSWSISNGTFSIAGGATALVIDRYFTVAHGSDGAKTASFTINYGATGTSTFGGGASVGVSLALTTLHAAPGVPVPSANTITSTSAVVTCTVPADNRSAITDYDIQVDDNSDFSSPVGTYNRGATATGLTPGTTYYMRANATNGVGTSAWSASVSFTAPAIAPNVPVPSVSSITSTSAVVTCTVPNSNGSAITDYDVQVDDNSDFSSPVGTYNRGDNVTGLSPGARYYVRARATNGVGTSAWSASISFVASSTAPSTPVAPAISNILVNGARATWTYPPANGSAITGYTLQVAKNTGFTVGLVTFNPTSSPYDFTGIDPATVYYARLSATNGVGTSSYGPYATFTSGATVPGAPTALTFGSILATSCSATFTAPADDGGVSITSYSLIVATDAGFTQNVKTFPGSGSPIALTGLLSGMLYYGKVRAANVVGNGSYSSVQTFTTADGVPTITAPTAGQTVTVGVGYPRVVVTSLGLYSSSQLVAEFSKDNTFATGVVTVTLNIVAQSPDNSYVIADTSQYLSTGTWYVRVKEVDTATSSITAWSSTVSYIQSHTPSASVVSPTASNVIEYSATSNFTFNFADLASPYDLQTAYRLVIENNATGTSLYDSGKVTLATTAINQRSVVTVAVGSGNKNTTLRWRVMVWDRGDTPSAWSGYGLFTLTDPPSVAITAPTSGGTVDSGTPTFTWTLALFSGGTQASTTVSVYDTVTSALVWSQTVAGVLLSITPPAVILLNGTDYYVVVSVTDSHDIVGEDVLDFSSVFESPPAVAYIANAAVIETLGYVTIDWSGFDSDPFFVAWKIYRRVESESTWELLYVDTDLNARKYLDYMFKSGYSYIYCVTQVAIRSLANVESPIGYYFDGANEVIDNRSTFLDVTKYWLIDIDDKSLSLIVPGVVDDQSTLEFESKTTHVIGRGRHRDYGDELGYTGTLKSKVRTPERVSSFRSNIEDLIRKRRDIYLRTPYGRIFQVALGDPEWSPLAGTGTAEMGDMSIPYEQVSQ